MISRYVTPVVAIDLGVFTDPWQQLLEKFIHGSFGVQHILGYYYFADEVGNGHDQQQILCTRQKRNELIL